MGSCRWLFRCCFPTVAFTLNWTELFDSPGAARKLYTGDFSIIDVGTINDDEIMKQRRMILLELMLTKARFNPPPG